MRRTLIRAAVVFCLVLVAGAATVARADLLSEGRDLYKAGKYPEAAAKLEQAVKQEPNNSKAWWQLNFAYNKLGRYADALNAVKKAGAADPAHTFASSPGKYEETLQRLQGKVGGAPGAPTAGTQPTAPPSREAPLRSSTSGSGSGSIVQQLMNGDVYAQPGINVDVARLQQVSQQLRPTVAKFVIFNTRSGSRALSQEGSRILNYLKSYMNQGQGYVILASRGGIAVATKSLNRDTIRDLTGQVAPQIEAGRYTEGLEALAKGLVQTRSSSARSLSGGTSAPVVVPRAHMTNWGLIIGVIVAIIVVIWIISALAKSAANRREMSVRMGPLNAQKSEVVAGINQLEESANGLDPAVGSQVKQCRIAAGTKLDEASRIMRGARSYHDLGRAESLLDQAQGDIARGRAIIDRATGVTPAPSPTAAAAAGGTATAATAAAASASTTDWTALPQNEKGVCFFCSRPMMLNELTPVTINLSGQQQKVLACPDDLATIKTGQTPQIRAFNDNGRYVPWYAYQNYDPYRDYYRGYGTGSFLGDLVTLSVIDHMFWNWHHPMGWGWGGGYGGWGGNTYVFYPDHEYYRDYYSGQAAGYGDFDRTPQDAAGTDFLQDTGGDTGGQDFGADRS